MTGRLCGLLAGLILAGCATTSTNPTASAEASATVGTAAASAEAPEAVSPAAAPMAQPAQLAAAERAARAVGTGLATDDESVRTDLWLRVRRGFAIPDLDNARVRTSEQWYAARPDYVARMTERSSRYMFYVVDEIERRGMPTELALLPYVESAFNPQALSVARASGMWQFMATTGRDFDLKQNVFRDDRRDVLASTRAALDYLSRLYAQFGDWQLALAAYNWGEGNVKRAIARNQKAGLSTDYASLKMPEETRNYVPKLQAVKNIVSAPAAFGLALPSLPNHPYFLGVPIERDIDVDLAVRLSGITLEEFKTLNPHMNKPVILAAGTPQILLPYDDANRFLHGLETHRGATASWTTWVAPKTLKPADAARQVGMSEAALREVNQIPPKMLVKAGSTLLVPRSPARQTDVPQVVADSATMALTPDAPPLRKFALKAGKKDTVASVARRYRVSAEQVAQWNHVGAGASFKAGQTVVVYAPAKTLHVAAKPAPKVSTRGRPVASERERGSNAPAPGWPRVLG